MHLAMHDALNSIVPVYERYAYTGPPQIAHPVAAVAQGAYEVLVSQYPGQQSQLAAEIAIWLGRVPNGALRDRGIALGRATAAAIVTLRTGDGFDVAGAYEFRSGPGQYQTTPPWNGFVAQPGFRFAKPFVLAFQSQFRPPPPPPLTSRAYARAFQEVKEFGSAASTRRTDDQTAYAVWWMEFAEGSVNRLARQLVAEHGLHLWVGARLFAHVGMALFDTYVAVWDSKYEYNHWRPYTAVRAADADDNPRTTPDPAWEPLRPTPPFPEYASAHATACAASFGVLERALGHKLSFTMETTTAPPGMPTRSFESFDAAAAGVPTHAMRLGWHYRATPRTPASRSAGKSRRAHGATRARSPVADQRSIKVAKRMTRVAATCGSRLGANRWIPSGGNYAQNVARRPMVLSDLSRYRGVFRPRLAEQEPTSVATGAGRFKRSAHTPQPLSGVCNMFA